MTKKELEQIKREYAAIRGARNNASLDNNIVQVDALNEQLSRLYMLLCEADRT